MLSLINNAFIKLSKLSNNYVICPKNKNNKLIIKRCNCLKESVVNFYLQKNKNKL